jgi:hypothetical protein
MTNIDIEASTIEAFRPISRRLSADLKEATRGMGRASARFLVAAYYNYQEDRIRRAAQLREMEGENSDALTYLMGQQSALEHICKAMLDQWSGHQELGRWSRSHKGVGPVISAGLLAYIDLDKAPVAASIFRFAGLDPSVRWYSREESKSLVSALGLGKSPSEEVVRKAIFESAETWNRKASTLLRDACRKGKLTPTSLAAALARRPWDAGLKTLMWKLGESFVYVSGREGAFYGQLYAQRKALETRRNEAGEFESQAKEALEGPRAPAKSTKAYGHYSEGRLPPARVHLRATRYAVKMFVSHWHEVGLRLMGKTPPKPYVIEHLGHAHYIPPPNLDVVGLEP